MPKGNIKVKALCLIMNDKKETLVSEDFDKVKKDFYYRPLGGHVEFNERTEDTVKREFLEEINAEVKTLNLFTIIENIFTCDGIPGHEIVFVYTGEFAEKELYGTKEFFFNYGHDKHQIRVFWAKIEDCLNGKYRFVPADLRDKLHRFI